MRILITVAMCPNLVKSGFKGDIVCTYAYARLVYYHVARQRQDPELRY